MVINKLRGAPPLRWSADKYKYQVSRTSVLILWRKRERVFVAHPLAWDQALHWCWNLVLFIYAKRWHNHSQRFLQILEGGSTYQWACIVITMQKFDRRVENLFNGRDTVGQRCPKALFRQRSKHLWVGCGTLKNSTLSIRVIETACIIIRIAES